MNDPLIASLMRAVDAAPEEHELRLHLAQQLHQANRAAEALTHINIVVQKDPGNTAALQLLGQVSAALLGNATPAPASAPEPAKPQHTEEPEFDWDAAAQQLGQSVPAPFAEP